VHSTLERLFKVLYKSQWVLQFTRLNSNFLLEFLFTWKVPDFFILEIPTEECLTYISIKFHWRIHGSI
jgi:hypothetical protein